MAEKEIKSAKLSSRGKRAKSSRISNEEWLYGYYYRDSETGNHLIQLFESEGIYKSLLVIPETVGYHIGICDDNLTPIFEGDIVETLKGKFTVEWNDDKGAFQFANEQTAYFIPEFYGDWKVVISTVHDSGEKQ